MLIENLYDSHVHLLATGQVAGGLHLGFIRAKEDLARIEIRSQYKKNEWLVGFGWDENLFSGWKPEAKILDHYFPDIPVFFSRCDGHSSWLNTLGLERLNLIEKCPEGILKEKDHVKALFSLPQYSREQEKLFLDLAIKKFNAAGFTHVRDMTSSREQFLLCRELEKEQKLSLHIQHNFVCEDLADLDNILKVASQCKAEETELLKVNGIKVFFDGSLGSETAFLSQAYRGSENSGQLNWPLLDIEDLLRRVWQSGFEVSIHCLGDEAAHQVVLAARKIYSENISGLLNLEHVQLLRPETIQMMKSLHVTCHMQPCHWHSDKLWLDSKVGSLKKYAFPWESLRAAKVPLFFGSDSPIESPSLNSNLQALKESAQEGIKEFAGSALDHHRAVSWSLPQTYTVFADGIVKELCFQGRRII